MISRTDLVMAPNLPSESYLPSHRNRLIMDNNQRHRKMTLMLSVRDLATVKYEFKANFTANLICKKSFSETQCLASKLIFNLR